MKLCWAQAGRESISIEKKNPLKQGLKQLAEDAIIKGQEHWKEESIKTRIETLLTVLREDANIYWKEESIKTRIETH